MEFATRTIHAGQPSEPGTGALIAPIFQTSTFEQDAPGVHRGFDYSRTNNPTRARLEAVLAELEGVATRRGLCLRARRRERRAAGVAEAGRRDRHPARRLWRHLPAAEPRCTSRPAASCGRSTSRIASALEAALTERTRLVWIESPTNPRLLVYDIADICRDRPRTRRAGRRRQHLRHAVLSAAVRARRRHRRAQRDEVPGRPLRPDPGRRARARRGGIRAGQVPAERHRRGALPVRLLADAARTEDARAADAASRGERGRDRRRAVSSIRWSSACSSRAWPIIPATTSPRGR